MKEYEVIGIEELNKIKVEDFINYVKKVRNDEITNVAPLGFSGEDYIVFENKNKPLGKEFVSKEEYEKDKKYYDKPVSRSSELSLRKYGSQCELLITDYQGNFLTYSNLSFAFDDEFIGKNFYQLFIQLKPYMNKVVGSLKNEIKWDKVKYSVGFDMMNNYINREKKENKIKELEEELKKLKGEENENNI